MKTRCINLKDFEARGLLDGSITALWRPVKPVPVPHERWMGGYRLELKKETVAIGVPSIDKYCPYGQPGDVLIGREAFWINWGCHIPYGIGRDREQDQVLWRADRPQAKNIKDWETDKKQKVWMYNCKWKSGAIMPSRFSRIRRELVSVGCIQAIKAKAPEVVAMFGGSLPKGGPVPLEQWFWKLTLKECVN